MIARNDGINPERFHAEIWDQLQYFFQEYNDHQLHGVIYFKNSLDWECLKKAVILSMDIVPLLGSRFVINKFRPYWEKAGPYNERELITLVETLKPTEEISTFITNITNELTGPQLMVRVVRCSGQDALCIVMNHMVCDGAGFKEYLYLLAKLYTQQVHGAGNNFEYRNGSRSSAQIYSQFNCIEKLKLSILPNEPLQNKNNVYFPLTGERDTHVPHIFLHKLPPELFQGLKQYGKEQALTVNDIVQATFYRALSKIVQIPKGDSLTIPCMVDLRRYLHGKKAEGICNLSSMIMCNIGPEIGDNLGETIKKVHQAMNEKKNGFPGLHGLATLNLLFRFLPFCLIRKTIKKKYVNPLIGITNIGIIDSDRLIFGNSPVEDVFVTGSIKYPPYFQLALSSYKNLMTFSVNVYGSEIDRVTIERFFTLLDEELEPFIRRPIVQRTIGDKENSAGAEPLVMAATQVFL